MNNSKNNRNKLNFTKNLVFLPFLIIVLMTLLNAFYNSMAVQLGFGFPYNTFLFRPDDLVADLLKYPLSFPGREIPDLSRWNELYQSYVYKNPYSSNFSSAGSLTNLHTMPITIILSIFQRYLLGHMSISVFLILFQCASAGFLFFTIINLCKSQQIRIISAVSFLFSYPFLFYITRGNFPAAILAGVIMISTHLSFYKKSPYLITFLIAVAVNIRPNTIYLLVLFFLSWGFLEAIIYTSIGLINSLLLLAVTSYAAHFLYPIYNFDNFLSAFAIYYSQYVLGNDGMAYGSSLLGGVKFIAYISQINLPVKFLDKFIVIILGILLVIFYYFYSKKLIDKFGFLYVIFSIYILYPNVFADYHLMSFFVISIIFAEAAIENHFQYSQIDLIIVCIVSFILAAKNFIFYKGVSYQVIFNPLLLLVGIGVIYFKINNQSSLMKKSFNI